MVPLVVGTIPQPTRSIPDNEALEEDPHNIVIVVSVGILPTIAGPH